jgi:hypothetical protein
VPGGEKQNKTMILSTGVPPIARLAPIRSSLRMTNGPDQDRDLQGNAKHDSTSGAITMVIHGGFERQVNIPDSYAF